VERNIIVPDVHRGAASARRGAALSRAAQPRRDAQAARARHLRQRPARHRGKGGENHQALQQRLQEARWFIKNIQQRFDTILRVSQAIVERQKSFFMHGELAMRPLVLREIADELGLHESTISRVTTAKYMATPRAPSS
jgi:RNA polymerase sigma-54 factor